MNENYSSFYHKNKRKSKHRRLIEQGKSKERFQSRENLSVTTMLKKVTWRKIARFWKKKGGKKREELKEGRWSEYHCYSIIWKVGSTFIWRG